MRSCTALKRSKVLLGMAAPLWQQWSVLSTSVLHHRPCFMYHFHASYLVRGGTTMEHAQALY